MPQPQEVESDLFLSRALEATIRIAIVGLLALWCFQILRPFIMPVVWGAIVAVAVHPLHQRLSGWLGGRSKLSATLLASLGLLLLLLPIGFFAGGVVDSAQLITERLDAQTLQVPAPPDSVAAWPLVGESIHEAWGGAAANLGDTLKRFTPQLRAVGGWLLAAGAGAGAAIVQFIISLLIAGVFLASSTSGLSGIAAVMNRLAGPAGDRYLTMAAQTVRSVAVGILGVAVIQASLLALGFVAVGLPHAGVWAFACLALGVLQLPATIVVVPVVIYVFTAESTLVAVLFTAWSVVAGLSDNVLKPILLGRGTSVPMLVIFLGSIGGFILSGFVGLFVGAVVLSLGYEILMTWIETEGEASAASSVEESPAR